VSAEQRYPAIDTLWHYVYNSYAWPYLSVAVATGIANANANAIQRDANALSQ